MPRYERYGKIDLMKSVSINVYLYGIGRCPMLLFHQTNPMQSPCSHTTTSPSPMFILQDHGHTISISYQHGSLRVTDISILCLEGFWMLHHTFWDWSPTFLFLVLRYIRSSLNDLTCGVLTVL